MTGQDFQDKLDAIVLDLQTKGKGKGITLFLRDSDNFASELVLNSDVNGNIDAATVAQIQAFINPLKAIADTYTAETAPITAASEAYRTAREAHQVLIDQARAARTALNDALEQDQNYLGAKTAYDAIRLDPDYIAARLAYKDANVSENFSNLGEAKGKYQA